MVAPNEIETYSARVDLIFDPPVGDVQMVIADLLQRVGSACMAAGASLIGHIKCYGEASGDRYLHCSLTSPGSGASCRGDTAGPCGSIGLDLNVLVYGLPHQVIDSLVRDSLQALAANNGMAFEARTNEMHPHHQH